MRIGLHHYLHLSFLFCEHIIGCWKITVCSLSSEKEKGECSTQYKIYACWRQQELLGHILEKNLAPCHKSSSDHLRFLSENYCMQTHELWIDSWLIARPPTLPEPLAAIQSWTMCETIMIFPSDRSPEAALWLVENPRYRETGPGKVNARTPSILGPAPLNITQRRLARKFRFNRCYLNQKFCICP